MSAAPTTHAELSALLCEALRGNNDAAIDALYDAEHVEPDDVRAIVAGMRDETKAMFATARARLGQAGPRAEVTGQEIRGGNWITRVRAGVIELEIIVDDVYERDGGLHTKDLLRIELVR